jgi:hypothetical protein
MRKPSSPSLCPIALKVRHGVDLSPLSLGEGWRRRRGRFGKAANLKVMANPKLIAIHSSPDDLAQVESFLTVGNDCPNRKDTAEFRRLLNLLG